ncbi:MAG: hypothetical protein ACREQZ_10860 [Woeseiaceae bacterium]
MKTISVIGLFPPLSAAADIFLMNADGTNVVQLTDDVSDSTPSFTPDEQFMVYASWR